MSVKSFFKIKVQIENHEIKSTISKVLLGITADNGLTTDPAGIYLLKVNNRNTRTRREICSKLTINTPERRH